MNSTDRSWTISGIWGAIALLLFFTAVTLRESEAWVPIPIFAICIFGALAATVLILNRKTDAPTPISVTRGNQYEEDYEHGKRKREDGSRIDALLAQMSDRELDALRDRLGVSDEVDAVSLEELMQRNERGDRR